MVSRLKSYDLRRRGQWEEAIQNITGDIEKEDALYVNWMWRGLAYRQLGQIILAIGDFTEAMKWDAPDPFYYRGNAYLAMGRYEEAAVDHHRYVELITVKNNAELARTHDINRIQRSNKKPDPINYPPLDVAFCLPSDCQLSLADCELALSAGQTTPLIYFCQGVGYEANRDYFQAIETYEKIDPHTSVGLAAQIAIARAQESALYVEPSDEALMRPGIEYLRVTTDHLTGEITYEYFNLNSYRKEVIPGRDEPHKRLSSSWQLMVQRSTKENAYHYYQCQPQPSQQGFWEMLKSKLSQKH